MVVGAEVGHRCAGGRSSWRAGSQRCHGLLLVQVEKPAANMQRQTSDPPASPPASAAMSREDDAAGVARSANRSARDGGLGQD